MPLFPAYAIKDADEIVENADTLSESQEMLWEPTAYREAQLLASDSEEESATKRIPPQPPPPPPPASTDDFYLDCNLDRGNLRVSTLYYPGRPQYERRGKVQADSGGRCIRRARRYWAKRAPDAPDAPAAADRAAAYRDLLLERPHDVPLWEQYIDFQEVCSGAEAALAAAEQAVERLPRSRRLRVRFLSVARAALPRDRLLQRLQDLLALEKCPRWRTDLWCWMVEEAGAGGSTTAARTAAAAALADMRTHPPAYPRLLHAYGVVLRMAGLWEELVLLVELAASMAGALPPPTPHSTPPAAEQNLMQFEERALASGLPLPALWVRVERVRAATHWLPASATDATTLAADPQRAPLAHELADLLRPLVGAPQALLLCGTLLRLAKVPLLPISGWVLRAWGAEDGECGDCSEALLGLLRAARRLPPAHPVRPPAHAPHAARRLLATLLDPPHYFTDEAGYLSWVRALWDACCGWTVGERRAALLAWRLRWLHALLMLAVPEADSGAAEVSRIRSEARSLLQRWAAGDSCGAGAPLAFAQFARIEHAAGATDRAVKIASRALRATLQDPASPRHYALYIARIVCEVSADGATGAEGLNALVNAVLGRVPSLNMRAPTDDELCEALKICEERCDELERRYAAGEVNEAIEGGAEGEAAQCLAALLPAEAEWAAARALLASPARRVHLLRALPSMLQNIGAELDPQAERYYEQGACALVFAGACEQRAASAYAVAQLFPHNAYLALVSAGAPLWALRGAGQGAGPGLDLGLRARPPPRTLTAALATLLPPLIRAQAADWAPQEAEACARAVRRAVGASGCALLGALRLEVEGRAPHPRLLPALYDALSRTPHAKWLYVRGAAWCGGEAGALADALLERQLRAHALLDELAALVPPASSAS